MTSKRESQLTTVTDFVSGDLLTGLRSAGNVNFSYSSLFNAMSGLTSLNNVGNSLAVPILDQPQAGVNDFRMIESGYGIYASVSAENGINISTNFTQPSGGASIIEDLSASVINFRGLKGIAPIEINLVNGFLEFSESSSPLAQTNTRIISGISDFPNAIAGVITLEDNINYVIVQPISTANRFVLGANNSITANNPVSPLFEYTGTGTFFTGVNVNLSINEIFLSCPSGKVFDLSTTIGTGNFFLARLVIVLSCAKYATFTNMRTVDINDSSALSCDDGITLAGVTNWSIFSLNKFSMNSTSATFKGVDLGAAVFRTLECTDLILNAPAGAIGILGLASGANITTGFVATVTNGSFFGGLTPLQTITVSDIRWDFKGNSGISDTLIDALVYVTANVTETVITTINTPVKATAVFTVDLLSRFTSDGAGRLTYIGERSFRAPIDLSTTITAASGGVDKQVSLYIAINGSVVAATKKQATVSGTKAASVTSIWQATLNTGDYIEAFVENNTDTTNIIVGQAVERVN